MKKVGAFEAKNKLGTLLDWVESGEEVVITRRGREIAKLIRVETRIDSDKARRAARGLLETARGLTLGPLKIKDLIDAGRR